MQDSIDTSVQAGSRSNPSRQLLSYHQTSKEDRNELNGAHISSFSLLSDAHLSTGVDRIASSEIQFQLPTFNWNHNLNLSPTEQQQFEVTRHIFFTLH